MAVKTYTLTDARQGTSDDFELDTSGFAEAARRIAVTKRTLRGGLRDGVEVVEIFNGRLQVCVVPTRGMGIWKVRRQDVPEALSSSTGGPASVQLGWNAPVHGPVHPKFVPLFAPDGLGWLQGFDEWLVRCGLESNGAPEWDEKNILRWPLHGKIANTPAHRVELAVDDATGEIHLTGIVDESKLYHNKLRLTSTIRMQADTLRFDILDEVTNLSAEEGELELLYHCNFGPPLLDPGARVVLPVRQVIPRDARAAEGIATWDSIGNEQPGYAEQVYFFELLADTAGRTQALLRNAHGNAGCSLHFNRQQLPGFTLWKSTQAAADGYVTGLEPATNLPNPRSFEKDQGRVIRLKPGEHRQMALGVELHADAESVAAAEAAIARLQGAAKPIVHAQPQPGWCPM